MTLQATQAAVAGDAALPIQLIDQIGKATTRMEEISTEMVRAKEEDAARWNALNAERQEQAKALTELQAAHQKAVMDAETQAAIEASREWRAFQANLRAPSMAAAIAGGRDATAAKASYEQGAFLSNVFLANFKGFEEQSAAKAALRELGVLHGEAEGQTIPGNAKATVGSSDATGGWIVPNAIVGDFIIPARIQNIYRTLMTNITGVTAGSVDLPFRSSTRSRAVVAGFNTLKENLDLAYNGYTATMYTLAAIYDIGNQFLRQSRGAAEQDVMQELAAAFAQGESYYIREGSGSSEPYGYTAALTSGPAAFRSSFSPTSTTLAGSIAKAIATAAGALAGRGVAPTAAVLSAAEYWDMVSQGTDSAGFFFAPAGGPEGIRPGTLMAPWGLPVYADAGADLQGTAAVVDNLVVADWKAFKVYWGQDYRVDSSDVANTRWDYNLTGFRGEEEMAFDARPAVYAGRAQMITDIAP